MGNQCNVTGYLLRAARPLEGEGEEKLDGEVGKAIEPLKHTVAVEARVLRDSHFYRIAATYKKIKQCSGDHKVDGSQVTSLGRTSPRNVRRSLPS